MTDLPEIPSDILSFYKEELAGEKISYIRDRASLTGKTVSQALQEVIDETVTASERVCLILEEGDAWDAWDAFVMGYNLFHMMNPCYRLEEIVSLRALLVTVRL